MTKKITSGAILYAPPTLEVSCFKSECSITSNFGNTESYKIFEGDNEEHGTQSW